MSMHVKFGGVDLGCVEVSTIEVVPLPPMPLDECCCCGSMTAIEFEMTFEPPALAVFLRVELDSTIDFSEADLEAIRSPWYGGK